MISQAELAEKIMLEALTEAEARGSKQPCLDVLKEWALEKAADQLKLDWACKLMDNIPANQEPKRSEPGTSQGNG
jgi:hypothetical protein